jgi:diaminopimelate decarboxylase
VYADAALSDESLSTFGEFMSLGEVSQMYLILQSKSQMDEFAQWFRGLKYSEGMQKLRVGLRIKLNLDINEDIYSVYHGPNARFGIPIQEAIKCLMELGKLGINSVGLQIYPGTNILDMKRLLAIYTSFVLDVGKLLNKYPATDTIDSLFLDFGGGFGFDYTERRCVSIDQISRTLNKALRSLSDPKRKVIELLFEPGRVIVGPTGILTAKVVDVKVEKKQHFVVLDAGLSHFARPYIYGEQHQISLIGTKGRTKQRTFITGCTMASGDFFAGNPIRNQLINFPAVKKGDTVCILDGGAYGFCMASNFSGLLKPAEALIDNGNNKWWIIRERETTETLLAEVPLCLSSL